MAMRHAADLRTFTPRYASPEQVFEQPISIASDIYSLGVLLYILLTGDDPYALRNFSTEELVRVRIRIVGEAAKPQAIAYRQNMTLLDVMIQAGGLTDFADGNSAVLVRNNTSYTVRLKDLLKRGDITANAAVAPGDVIIVPQSWF